jgi:hypothetical protein
MMKHNGEIMISRFKYLCYLVFIGAISSVKLFACSIEIPPLRKDYRRAESVFVAKVIKVEETTLDPSVVNNFPAGWRDWKLFSRISFQIERQWKGPSGTQKEYVGVAFYGCGCPGGPFDQFVAGNEYLVFGGSKNFLTVCESEKTGSEYISDKMKRLDKFWFRTWVEIYPF